METLSIMSAIHKPTQRIMPRNGQRVKFMIKYGGFWLVGKFAVSYHSVTGLPFNFFIADDVAANSQVGTFADNEVLDWR